MEEHQDISVMDEVACELVVRLSNGNYKCNICDKMFLMKSHVNRHMVVHAGQVRHKCKVCPMEFFLKSDLHKHLLLHSGDTTGYKCEICDKKFSHSGGLSQHMLLHGVAKNMFECKVCFRQYTYRSSLNRHLLVHEDQDKYGCGECRKQFTDKAKFLSHVQKKECSIVCQPMLPVFRHVTPSVIPPTSKPHTMLSFEKKLPTCKVCSKTFSYKHGLYKHCHAVHPEINCGCRNCEKRFDEDKDEVQNVLHCPEKGSLNQNRKTNETTLSVSEMEVLKCHLCLNTFSHRTDLDRHYHDLHPEFNCGCRNCEERLADSSRHVDDNGIEYIEMCSETKIKDDDVKSEIEFVCGECDEKFKSKEAFSMHVQAQECSDSFEAKHIGHQPSSSGYMSKDFEETATTNSDGKRTIKLDIISTKKFKEGNCDGIIIKSETPE